MTGAELNTVWAIQSHFYSPQLPRTHAPVFFPLFHIKSHHFTQQLIAGRKFTLMNTCVQRLVTPAHLELNNAPIIYSQVRRRTAPSKTVCVCLCAFVCLWNHVWFRAHRVKGGSGCLNSSWTLTKVIFVSWDSFHVCIPWWVSLCPVLLVRRHLFKQVQIPLDWKSFTKVSFNKTRMLSAQQIKPTVRSFFRVFIKDIRSNTYLNVQRCCWRLLLSQTHVTEQFFTWGFPFEPVRDCYNLCLISTFCSWRAVQIVLEHWRGQWTDFWALVSYWSSL